MLNIAFKSLFLGFLLFALAFKVNAQTLSVTTFEDQFSEAMVLDENTQWVVFSFDKTGGDWVHEALTELAIEDIAQLQGLYVADISAMPGIITRMFALPKMRKYDYKLALDLSGELTQDWPQTDGTVTLMKLDGLKVTEMKKVNQPEQIKAFIAQFK